MSFFKATLIHGMAAGAVIEPFTIVKVGAADNTAIPGAAATDNLLGVTPANGADAIGDTVDVILGGIAEVEIAGTVARGAQVTSNASGKGVATTTAGNRSIGIALASGVSGDVIPVILKSAIL